MIIEMVDVVDIPALEHDEAMAALEYERVLDVVDRLSPGDWSTPTDCTGWDVKDVVSHLLGWMEANAIPPKRAGSWRSLPHRGSGRGRRPSRPRVASSKAMPITDMVIRWIRAATNPPSG
jgi:uncharacterized protein (TIGR03083 family)